MEHIPDQVIAILLAVIMLTVVPLVSIMQRQDDVAYVYVYNEVNMFVEEVRDKGYITPEHYEIFASKLAVSGNAFDIELEHSEKLYVPDPVNPGAFLVVYSGNFNYDILNDTLFASSPSNYNMDKGDLFTVHVKNTSTSYGEAVINMLSRNDVSGTFNIRIGGMVNNDGN